MPQLNVTKLLISLAVSIILAIVTGSMAEKKGYSRAGFTVYGFFLFLPALIHVWLLPDKNDPNRKQYKGKALACSITATVTLVYATVIGALYDFSWMWKALFGGANKYVPYLLLLLIVAAMLGRKYVYSIVVYVLAFGLYLLNITLITVQMATSGHALFLQYYRDRATTVSVIAVTGIVYGIVLTLKYGIKKQTHPAGQGAFQCALPALILAVSFAVDNILSRRYFDIFSLVVTLLVEVLIVVAVFCLGRFLYEESAEEL